MINGAINESSKQGEDIISTQQALWVYLKSLIAGELTQFNRQGAGTIAPYTTIIKTTAATVAKSGPALVYGFYVQTATTSLLTVYDGITTASSDTIFINSFPTTGGVGGSAVNGNGGFIPILPGGGGVLFNTGCLVSQTSAASIFPLVI